MKKKLIRNTVINFGIRIWSFILTLALFWYIVAQIGPEDYGIYLFVGAIIGYFGILNLGIGNSLVKFVSQYHAEDDKEKLNEVVNTTFFIFIFIGIAGALVLFLFGTFILNYLSSILPTLDDPEFYPKARAILYILAANFIFSFALISLNGILAGLQRYDILALINFIKSIINLVVVVLVLSLGYGVVELVFYTVITGLFGFILVAIYIQKLLPHVSIKFSYLNRKMVKVLMDLSLSIFLLTVFVSVIYHTDRLVIGLFVGVALITFYEAAWKVYNIPGRLPEIGLYAVIPAAAELDVQKDFESMRKLFLRGTKYVLGLCLAIAVPLIFLSRETLIIWMGEDFGEYYLVAQILIMSLFLDFNNYVANQILIGMNKIRPFVKYYGVVAALNLGLSLYLVHLGFGLTGVALGTTIPFVIMEVFFLRHVFKVLNIGWKTYLRKVFAKTYTLAVPVAVLMYALVTIFPPEAVTSGSLIEMVTAFILNIGPHFILGCGAYLILFYFLSLESHEKGDLKGIFSSLKARKA